MSPQEGGHLISLILEFVTLDVKGILEEGPDFISKPISPNEKSMYEQKRRIHKSWFYCFLPHFIIVFATFL